MRRLNKDLVNMLKDWGSYESRKIGLEHPGTTPIGKMLHSPGRATKRGAGPHYEPEPVATRVNMAIGELGKQDKLLLGYKYKMGASDRYLALYCDVTKSAITWAMEIAHRNIAGKLKIPVYK